MKRLFLTLLMSLAPIMVAAESYDNVVSAELRPGWRLPDGSHMAALHVKLAPGWKTYWRAPGDAGIPPQFQWTGTKSVTSVKVHWPAPSVFHQSGMRSVGYADTMVLPLHIRLKPDASDAQLRGVVDLGICKDVCIPHQVRLQVALPATATKPDATIAAALADEPYTAQEAGVTRVRCTISPAQGGLSLRAHISMPKGTGQEQTVIETANPEIWVGEPRTWWQGRELVAEAKMAHMNGSAMALDRSGVRITVLGGKSPVDIRGCDS